MVRRDGKDEKHVVYPVVACAIPVVLGTDANSNAFTDYRKIVIQSGILRAAQNDSDLAVVVGHELAHVNMGHYGKKLQNALLGAASGAVIDGGLLIGGIYTGGTFMKHFEVAGERTFSVDFEREADYVGAYYAARAGYDVSGADEYLARRWRWKAPTTSAPPRPIRRRRCVSCRCKKPSPRSRTKSGAICRSSPMLN